MSPKIAKNKRVYALKGGWTIAGIAKKSAKIRGFMHEGAGGLIGLAKSLTKISEFSIKGRVDNKLE